MAKDMIAFWNSNPNKEQAHKGHTEMVIGCPPSQHSEYFVIMLETRPSLEFVCINHKRFSWAFVFFLSNKYLVR